MITREELNRRLREYDAALPPGAAITWTVVDGTGMAELAVWTVNGYTFVSLDLMALEASPELLGEKVSAALERLASE